MLIHQPVDGNMTIRISGFRAMRGAATEPPRFPGPDLWVDGP